MDSNNFHKVLGDLEPQVLTIQNVTKALALFAHNYELDTERSINDWKTFEKTGKVYSTYRNTDLKSRN